MQWCSSRVIGFHHSPSSTLYPFYLNAALLIIKDEEEEHRLINKCFFFFKAGWDSGDVERGGGIFMRDDVGGG